MTLKEFVSKMLKKYGSINNISRHTKISHRTLTLWLEGQITIPKDASIAKIAKEMGWTIDEAMQKLEVENIHSYLSDVSNKRTHNPKDDTKPNTIIDIPLIASAYTNNGLGKPNNTFIPLPKLWLKQNLLAQPESLEAVQVVGDSMLPLQDGDIVIISRNHTSYNGSGVYVICYNNEVLVKRLLPLPKRKLQLINDNTIYPPLTIDLSKDNIEILGKVVATLCKYC